MLQIARLSVSLTAGFRIFLKIIFFSAKQTFFKRDTKFCLHLTILKMKKIPSNKALTLSKIMNMDIWVVGTLNQLFIRGSKTETKFLKKK